MKYILISLIWITLVCIAPSVTAQFSDSFDDGDFTSMPAWQGDVADFIVNNEQRLQLNAAEAGTSRLYTSGDFPDSMVVSFELELDFSPSTSNLAKVYFMINDPNVDQANGYYLNFGSSGSTDAVEMYRLDGGSQTLIGLASPEAIATSTITQIEITRRNGGEWTLKAGYDNSPLQVEFSITDDTYSPQAANTFLIDYKYTSTRTTLFYLDDVVVKEFETDKTPPTVSQAIILNESEIQVDFDESMDLPSTTDVNNYTLSGDIGKPDGIINNSANDNSFTLMYDTPLSKTGTVILSVSGVKDVSQNEIAQVDLSLFFSRPFEVGDLSITEILFDPVQSGEDFIEVYNESEDFIEISGLEIGNTGNGQLQVVTDRITMAPNTYAALTSDLPSLLDLYLEDLNGNAFETRLPSFNNSDGNCTISKAGEVLDAIDYTEDMHLAVLNDTEGVSLEKIDLTQSSFSIGNWTSSSSNRNATPGLPNANEITLGGNVMGFEAAYTTFSPDGDGNKDLMLIKYSLPTPGYVLQAEVLNSDGSLVRSLSNNELLGLEGLLSWDGRNDGGILQNYGIYIVALEYFNINGKVARQKIVTVLGGNL